jgi:hypothetical protein
MQTINEITDSERYATIRHNKVSGCRLPMQLTDKFLMRYEVKVKNLRKEVVSLKMELDDRELAIKYYLDGKLDKQHLKELINYE